MAQPLGGVQPRASLPMIARSVYAREGARGFYRGLGPTFLRAFPANASAFFVYEATLRLLGAEKVRARCLPESAANGDCRRGTRGIRR